MTLWYGKNKCFSVYIVDGDIIKFSTAEEAIDHVGYTDWFVKKYPHGIYIILNENHKKIWDSRSIPIQIPLFGETK